ncbi:MAG: histidine phosphatase family protein [Patescibacteria group bacterium]|jgi:broad specificity phosphatase PhoE
MNEQPEKIVYFVRHGQSEANSLPIYQPLDSPLTELGKKQALHIAKRIARLSFEVLIASPLTRSKQTAEVIGRITGHKPEYSDLFVERAKPARLVGKSHLDEDAKKLWNEWEKSLFTSGIRVEESENYDDLVVRAGKALDYLRARKEKEIVVVTHGFFLQVIFALVLLGVSLTPETFKYFKSRISMENTGLSVLKYCKMREGIGWRVWIYNDHAHLG